MKNLLKILLLTFLLSCGKELEEPGPPVIETAEDLKEFLEGEWIDANPPDINWVARFWEDSLLFMSDIDFDVSQIAYYHVIDKDSIRIRREFLWMQDSIGWLAFFGGYPSEPLANFVEPLKYSRNKVYIYSQDSIKIDDYAISFTPWKAFFPVTFKRVRN